MSKDYFENKVFAITGVSDGLGYELCKHYLKLGANVIACARNSNEKLNKFNSPNFSFVTADVSKESDVKKFIEQGIKHFGEIDTLINNAGIYGPKGPIEIVDWEEWVYAINVNLLGSVLMTKNCLPFMKEKNKGSIIQLSGGGATSPMPYLTSYAVSKAAIVRFVESLSLELRSYNIKINAVAPGPMNTRLLQEIIDSGPDLVGEDFYQKSLKQKQNGGVSFVNTLHLCDFLASPLSQGISGKLISAIWDNWSVWPDHLMDLNNSDIYTLRRITGKDRNCNWGDID
jgi:NAD(P)-dependent dehydrogenase (short-subunit alcohol dehydrogenase family)